jgi:hypothetical protein
MRRFERVRGESTTETAATVGYWQALLEGAAVLTESGEAGNEGSVVRRRRSWPSAELALAAVEEQARHVLRQGFVEVAVPGGTPLGPGEPLDSEPNGTLEATGHADPGLDAVLEAHRAECRATVRAWSQRRVEVPRALLAAVWVDPEWRAALQLPLAEASDAQGSAHGRLFDLDDGGRVGVREPDGSTRWLDASVVVFYDAVIADV